MSKVFIPIVPMRWDPIKEIQKPVHDLSPARQYGEAIVLIPEEQRLEYESTFDIQPMIDQIMKRMKETEEDDYIVAVGDPILIAAAVFAQAMNHERIRILRWDRNIQRYKIMEFRI